MLCTSPKKSFRAACTEPALCAEQQNNAGKPHAPCRHSAFSLIELLVVIAVVAILSTILLPALGNMRERGQAVESASRMRALYMAFVAFSNDNQGRLPTNGVSEVADEPENSTQRWNLQLAPYLSLGSLSAADIHTGPYFRPPWTEVDANGNRANSAVGTYGYNNYFIGRNGQIALASIPRPATTILLAEVAGPSGGLAVRFGGPHPDATSHGWKGSTSKFGPAPDSGGKSGFLFVDGHIERRTIVDASNWPWNDPHIFNPLAD